MRNKNGSNTMKIIRIIYNLNHKYALELVAELNETGTVANKEGN